MEKLRLVYAYGGLLYAPIFVASQLGFLPVAVELVPADSDVDALRLLQDDQAELAICDPFALSDGGRSVLTDDTVIVETLISTTPIWVLSNVSTVGRSLSSFKAAYSEAIDKALSSPGKSLRSPWTTLSEGTTAYCLTRVCAALAGEATTGLLDRILQAFRSRAVTGFSPQYVVRPSSRVHNQPWSSTDPLAVCLTADPYEVAILKAKTAQDNCVRAVLGRERVTERILFTGAVSKVQVAEERRLELAALWSGLTRAARLLERGDNKAIEALVAWYKIPKYGAPVDLDPATTRSALELITGARFGSDRLAVKCWRPPTDVYEAAKRTADLWVQTSSNAASARAHVARHDYFDDALSAALQRVEEAKIDDSTMRLQIDGRTKRYSGLATAWASLAAAVLMIAAVAAASKVTPANAFYAVTLGIVTTFTALICIVRSVKFARALRRLEPIREWLLLEIGLWLTLASVFFGSFLEVRDHIEAEHHIASQAGTAAKLDSALYMLREADSRRQTQSDTLKDPGSGRQR